MIGALGWMRRKLLIPGVRRIDRYLSNKLRKWADAEPPLPEWKEKSLEDFAAWLREIPDSPPPGDSPAPESCDLFTLLSEFSALRQEIRLQTREQSKSLGILSDLETAYRRTADLLADRSERLSAWEAEVRKEGEKRGILPFLEVRDALSRGLAAGIEVAGSKRYFRPPPAGIQGVVEGYEMAIRRFDAALAQAGIRIVATVGLPFDPKSMRAVALGAEPGKPPGIVLSERLAGFARGDEILRTAEVVVNEQLI
jgi:molecular chaperone GrpE (heat shock protein)